MRLLSFLFALTIFITSCDNSPKYGSMTGNVYWKYNNYVGNKPDAGSKVYLYPNKKDGKALEATADVQGNFKFDKVETGEYLLIVVSENTTNSPEDHVRELQNNSYYLKDFFGFDFSSVLPDKQKEVKLRDSIIWDMRTKNNDDNSGSKFLKQLDIIRKKEDTLKDVAAEIIKALPVDLTMKFGILTSYGNKFEIKRVTIEKDKATTEVIDFGITYM